MNGPTRRRFAVGSARRTSRLPMSLVRGMIRCSIASQAGASPAMGSFPGKKDMELHLRFSLSNHCCLYVGQQRSQALTDRLPDNRAADPIIIMPKNVADTPYGLPIMFRKKVLSKRPQFDCRFRNSEDAPLCRVDYKGIRAEVFIRHPGDVTQRVPAVVSDIGQSEPRRVRRQNSGLVEFRVPNALFE